MTARVAYRDTLPIGAGVPRADGAPMAPTAFTPRVPASPPASPPANKVKRSPHTAKEEPPSPPMTIKDRAKSGETYARGKLLGTGGFAKVYEVRNSAGTVKAAKVVPKGSLVSKKNKTKLFAEIKIHQSLDHPNIVCFEHVFEDMDNVYMTLELCKNGTLMDLIRRRRAAPATTYKSHRSSRSSRSSCGVTEPETRYFMVQMIGALQYMHSHNIIHRDLKLGNIFLDDRMDVKVGDFGLAALLQDSNERKRTICGTPNYIAPEVLYSTTGHSFEVDIWSLGVIMYTLLVGKPPFQTKDVKSIYRKIKINDYVIPPDVMSEEAQDLISWILTTQPTKRPSLEEILEHAWFTCGPTPAFLSSESLKQAPDFSVLSPATWARNFAELRRRSYVDVQRPINTVSLSSSGSTRSLGAGTAPQLDSKRDPGRVAAEKATLGRVSEADELAIAHDEREQQRSREQQEREMEAALQPGSPISSLIKTARQPLIKAPSPPSVDGGANGKASASLGTGQGKGDQPLFRVISAAAAQAAGYTRAGASERENKENAPLTSTRVPTSRRASPLAMHHVDSNLGQTQAKTTASVADKEQQLETLAVAREADERRLTDQKARLVASMAVHGGSGSNRAPASPRRSDALETTCLNLRRAFEARAEGIAFRANEPLGNVGPPRVFLVSWLDYCNKYGMGYALTDGSVGVRFNDGTSMTLSPAKDHFDYIAYRRTITESATETHSVTRMVRRNYPVSDSTGAHLPKDVKTKLYLLKHFDNYMMERLYGDHPFTFKDEEKMKWMDFVVKFERLKKAMAFRLSNDVLQFNFFDHTKLILSRNSLAVTLISPDYTLTTWSLEELFSPDVFTVGAGSVSEGETEKVESVIEKLDYVRRELRAWVKTG